MVKQHVLHGTLSENLPTFRGYRYSLGLQKQSGLGGISVMQHLRVQHVFLVFWMEDTLELLQMLVISKMQSVLNE